MIEFSCFIFFWYSNSFFQSIIYYNFDKQKEIQFQKREGRTNFLWTTLLWFGSIQHIATELILINIIMSQTIQLICDVRRYKVRINKEQLSEINWPIIISIAYLMYKWTGKAFLSFDNTRALGLFLKSHVYDFGQMNDGSKSSRF